MDLVAILSINILQYTEHTWSRNMEATFRGNHTTLVYQSEMVTTYTEHIRSINMEATFR